MDAGLRARWDALWARLGGAGDPAPVYDELEARWGEPHRAYHTPDHLRHCLAELDGEPAAGDDRDAVELALWFHDAVYEPRAKDNEERSAALLRRLLAGRVPPVRVGRAAELVLATRHDQPAPGDPDGRLIVDVDLAILGAPPDRYARYEAAIRREYAWLPAPLWRRGRRQVLERFLGRGTIYLTPAFRARYESAARRNLRAALDAL